jgi:Pyridoxamine 5'-phosphate oxidase
VRWTDFEREQPRLAAVGRTKLLDAEVLLVATVRVDGSPRMSAVEPLLWRGDLWLCMGWGSRKARDLHRDPQILVHSIVTSRDGTDGEYQLRGRAVSEPSPQSTPTTPEQSPTGSAGDPRSASSTCSGSTSSTSHSSAGTTQPMISTSGAGPRAQSSCAAARRQPARDQPNPSRTSSPNSDRSAYKDRLHTSSIRHVRACRRKGPRRRQRA